MSLETPAKPLVLVIEDDESIREIVSRVLESEGYATRVAPNGLKGLEQFYLSLPDLIILDLKMPEMDGWETLERIRQVSGCPIIILTVFGSSDDIIKGLEMGADDYLVKPFGIQELLARVGAVIRRANLVRQGSDPALDDEP